MEELTEHQLKVLYNVMEKIRHSKKELIVMKLGEETALSVMAYLPYMLGKGIVKGHKPNLLSSKPILLLTTSAYSLVKLTLVFGKDSFLSKSGVLESTDSGGPYSTYVVSTQEFSDHQLEKHDIIMAGTFHYDWFSKDYFSFIVIFGINYISPDVQRDIILQFPRAKFVLIYNNGAGEEDICEVANYDDQLTDVLHITHLNSAKNSTEYKELPRTDRGIGNNARHTSIQLEKECEFDKDVPPLNLFIPFLQDCRELKKYNTYPKNQDLYQNETKSVAQKPACPPTDEFSDTNNSTLHKKKSVNTSSVLPSNQPCLQPPILTTFKPTASNIISPKHLPIPNIENHAHFQLPYCNHYSPTNSSLYNVLNSRHFNQHIGYYITENPNYPTPHYQYPQSNFLPGHHYCQQQPSFQPQYQTQANHSVHPSYSPQYTQTFQHPSSHSHSSQGVHVPHQTIPYYHHENVAMTTPCHALYPMQSSYVQLAQAMSYLTQLNPDSQHHPIHNYNYQ